MIPRRSRILTLTVAALVAVGGMVTVGATPAMAGDDGEGGFGNIGVWTGTPSGGHPKPIPPPGDHAAPPKKKNPAPGTVLSRAWTVSGTVWGKRPRLPARVPSLAGEFHGCSVDRLGQAAIGVTWRFKEHDVWNSGVISRAVPGSLKTRCLYPHPPKYDDKTLRCPISLTAKITLRDNPMWDLNGEIVSKTVTTPFGKTRSLANCNSPAWSLALNAPLDAFGRYTAQASSLMVTGIVRTYTTRDPRTNRVPAPRLIGSWSKPFVFRPDSAFAQVSCLGVSRKPVYRIPGTSRSFTFDSRDCPTSPSALIRATCTTTGQPSMYRRDNPSVVIRGTGDVYKDGATWVASWPTPRITGATKVYGQTTTLVRAPGGTPWREGAGPRSNTQFFEALLEKPVTGIQSAGWEHSWHKGGAPGRPTVTSLVYKTDADWVSPRMPVITSINTKTGDLTISQRSGAIRASAACQSDPLTINVWTSRISSQR